MGSGRWDSSAWSSYSTAHVAGKSSASVFKSTHLKEDFDPKLINVRESRDSVDNPNSTPIIVGVDVTGSMGIIADNLIRDGLNTLATEIYARKPVTDPHLMALAIGDVESDQAPLQATQFEADIRIAKQLQDVYLEKGGGPNDGESYNLAHLFAAEKTVSDAWEKRGKKGYLFTVGDEPVLEQVTSAQSSRFLGLQLPTLSTEECIRMASARYEVFHVVINERRRSYGTNPILQWQVLLPQRVIVLDDHTKLAETIVSAIQVTEGAKKADVAGSWSDGTSLVVASAIQSLVERGASTGVRRLA